MKHSLMMMAGVATFGAMNATQTMAETKDSRPNIVVILADDLGSGDVSFYRDNFMKQKAVVRTPNIDALAEGGMWFTDGHSSTSLCAPTRYAIMSGKNNYRSFAPWGVWNSYFEGAIKPGQMTIGAVASKAGYESAFIGKWHLGLNFAKRDGKGYYRGNDKDPKDLNSIANFYEIAYGGPKDLGFTYSYALPTGVQGPLYMAYENEKWAPFKEDSKLIAYNETTAVDGDTILEKDRQDLIDDGLKLTGKLTISDKGPGMGDSNWRTSEIPEIISTKAVNFINENAGKNPFFLYYCSPSVHRPHIPPVEFDGVKIAHTTPSRHLDILKVLDLEVKRIVDALKANNVYEDTLIFFIADNGGLTWQVPGTMKSGHRPSGNYRGAKSAPHEGGHRIPFIAHWPKEIKPGSFSDELVITHDLMATMAKIVGTELTEEESLDTNNILPVLLGEDDYNPRKFLISQSGATFEVMFREDGWKLIVQCNHELTKWEPIALFNLNDNTAENEKENLIHHPEYQEKVKHLFNRYKEVRADGRRTAPINK